MSSSFCERKEVVYCVIVTLKVYKSPGVVVKPLLRVLLTIHKSNIVDSFIFIQCENCNFDAHAYCELIE